MRIICGTDLSIHATAAAMTAGSLAARLELPLTLVHVVNPDHYTEPSPDLLRHLRTARQKKLQALAERAGRRGAIVETAVLEGSPAVELSELSEKAAARFLVVSAMGQIAPTQWLAGSVTDEATQMSPVPTLVLRDPRSFEAWLQGERRLKVIAGYDFSASSDAALRWVASLEAIAPCEITIAYVASPPRERARLGISAPLTPHYYPSALKNFLEEEVARKTSDVLGKNAEIAVRADWGRPGSQLIEMAADTRTDLMVVGASQRRGFARFGSVARAVMHYSQANVACVPEGWAASQSRSAAFRDASQPLGTEGAGHWGDWSDDEYAVAQ